MKWWLWHDPNRWVDADMQRNANLHFAALMFLVALLVTALAVAAGVMLS